MKALILAAGFGTRLRPLTLTTPKPLFPILNRPIIDITIHQLKEAGCEAIAINTHHLAERIAGHISNQSYGVQVMNKLEPVILGTAGAVKNLKDFWDDNPFIVINGDILTDIDLYAAYNFHKSQNTAATLVLHDLPRFNSVLVDKNEYIIGFDKPNSGCERRDNFRRLAFTGIHIMSHALLDFIPSGNFSCIIDIYQKMIDLGVKIKGFIVSGHYWEDIGSLSGYRHAVRDSLAHRFQLPGVLSQAKDIFVGNDFQIGKGSRLEGWNAIGDSVIAGENCLIRDSIVWDEAIIKDGVVVEKSVIGKGRVVESPAFEVML
ncbi:MAG: NDP-sugar synthase [Pseudomonadota bacterium]